MTAYKLNRNVTREECNWLDRDYKEGEIVYPYSGCTYGCIGDGTAVTEQPEKTPFFEMPWDALNKVRL